MSESKRRYTLLQLANHIDAELRSESGSESDIQRVRDIEIVDVGSLATARPDEITFVSSPRYRAQVADSQAGALILTADMAQLTAQPVLICEAPYVAYARISQLFDRAPTAAAGVHASAVVHPQAQVAADVCIGPNAVIEQDAVVEAGTWIGAGTVVGQRSRIGPNCRIAANVTLYHDVQLGSDCFIHSGAVLGGDGFGFAPTADGGWERIAQNGGVRLGNGVSIGVNSAVDRGAIGDTVLEDGVLIDNLCQIGHNVHIGRYTGMAGMSGIAGSTRIGAHCMIGGFSAVTGHIEVVDGVQINGGSSVINSITEKGVWASGSPLLPVMQWRRTAVRVTQLDQLNKRVRALENSLLEKGKLENDAAQKKVDGS
jgi:UDP-3-O-[3-hydroxymyristoyl] glucosamine N-acyltransferase